MKSILTILFLAIASQLFAQSQSISGRVVDSQTQEGIGFTSIGIEGTFHGTATDPDGYFQLTIPEEYFGDKLYVSAVAYQNLSYDVSELLEQDFIRIPLVEQTYSLEGVDVTAQSRVLFRIISTAVQNIPENYYTNPTGLKFYYKEETQGEDSDVKSREAIIQFYDENGYDNPSVTDAYVSRNYMYTHVNKNFESYSFPDGDAGFDELLDMDMARLGNTIFNLDLLNDYVLTLEGTTSIGTDSAWVISYKTNELDIAHTGDYKPSSLDGKMYILKSNYALVRNECVIEADAVNPGNRSVMPGEKANEDVWYHYVCTYAVQGNRYALQSIECDKTYSDASGTRYGQHREAEVLEIEPLNPEKIVGRDYFENVPTDVQFWNSFHSPMKL